MIFLLDSQFFFYYSVSLHKRNPQYWAYRRKFWQILESGTTFACVPWQRTPDSLRFDKPGVSWKERFRDFTSALWVGDVFRILRKQLTLIKNKTDPTDSLERDDLIWRQFRSFFHQILSYLSFRSQQRASGPVAIHLLPDGPPISEEGSLVGKTRSAPSAAAAKKETETKKFEAAKAAKDARWILLFFSPQKLKILK